MRVRSPQQAGFTLIEMIVALAVFSVVITISVGALLMLIAANQQLQNEQSVMTNLSFALDSMTREIRTGSGYICVSANALGGTGNEKIFKEGTGPSSLAGVGDDTFENCASGPDGNKKYHGISFVEGGQSITGDSSSNNRITYYYNNDANSDDYQKLFRLVSGEDSAESIASSGIRVLNAQFYVTGSYPQSDASNGENIQPTVSIFIQAQDVESDDTYNIQTMVTQRTTDL